MKCCPIVEASHPKLLSHTDRAETTSINRMQWSYYYESLSDNRDNIRSTAFRCTREENRIEKILEEQRHKKSLTAGIKSR